MDRTNLGRLCAMATYLVVGTLFAAAMGVAEWAQLQRSDPGVLDVVLPVVLGVAICPMIFWQGLRRRSVGSRRFPTTARTRRASARRR